MVKGHARFTWTAIEQPAHVFESIQLSSRPCITPMCYMRPPNAASEDEATAGRMPHIAQEIVDVILFHLYPLDPRSVKACSQVCRL